MDDMIEHPFLTTKIEEQKHVKVKDLIKNSSKNLQLNSNGRINYLGEDKAFGYGKGERVSEIDKDLLVNDHIIDEIFGVNSKITIYEREEDGYIVISTKTVGYD